MLSWAEHEKSFIMSGPDCTDLQADFSVGCVLISEDTCSYIVPLILSVCL